MALIKFKMSIVRVPDGRFKAGFFAIGVCNGTIGVWFGRICLSEIGPFIAIASRNLQVKDLACSPHLSIALVLRTY